MSLNPFVKSWLLEKTSCPTAWTHKNCNHCPKTSPPFTSLSTTAMAFICMHAGNPQLFSRQMYRFTLSGPLSSFHDHTAQKPFHSSPLWKKNIFIKAKHLQTKLRKTYFQHHAHLIIAFTSFIAYMALKAFIALIAYKTFMACKAFRAFKAFTAW